MTEENKIHSQIQYRKEDGTWIHSDTCPPACLSSNINMVYEKSNHFKTYREYLHAILDEYLDNVHHQNRGYFYIGNHNDINPLI